ncbi:inorganic phosphate transporter [Crenothrix polyspora]|uniref:Phosphate transporter n=1 Tax=Crenothrix polyspora TaxID=360316 RepID=A0A1R4HBY0_9GAMM|nr:inorganic phosphate transporter [Crenothrix polyspora]SJM93758.1 Phosphate transporter [Crenothrix polyspora]
MTTVLIIAVCFLAFANGANDNFKGVASLYGSGASSYRCALAWTTVSTLAGSVCAIYLANALLVKFSGKGVAPDALIQSIPFMTAVATGAGLTVLLATRFGFPISTTHALLGAIVGSVLAAAPETINFVALQKNFFLPLLLSPLIAVLLSIAVYSSLKQLRLALNIGQDLCLCTESIASSTPNFTAAPVSSVVMLENTRAVLSVDNAVACQQRQTAQLLGFNVQRVLNGLHFLSAGTVCFARGLNDTPKIAGLLWLAPPIAVQWVIVLIAALMALGGVLNSRRIAETMSHKITAISPSQGLAANLSTACLVILASKFGLPVSTTHVSVGALFGIGLRNQSVNGRMMAGILLAWITTLPCAALCAAAMYSLVSMA